MSGSFKLYNNDSRVILNELIDKKISVDLVVTSPPYDNLRNYHNSLEWDFSIFKEIVDKLYAIVGDGGVIVWIVGDATINGSETGTSFRQALYFKEIGFRLHDTMIYLKKNPIPLNHNRYEQGFEYMFVFSKGKPKTFNPLCEECKIKGKYKGYAFHKTDSDDLTKTKGVVKDTKIKRNVFEYGVGGTNYGHPAVFPLQLAKDQIISWSNPNDLVLDPFMGSGTTGVACKELNRRFIGVEMVTEYYNIAEKRINDGQTKLNIN